MHTLLSRLISFAFFLTIALGPARADRAQPRLPEVQLTIRDTRVLAEVADEPHERENGLMNRDGLAENCGMLFVMDFPGPATFWMKNTKIPLSIAYIDAAGMILEIHDMKPMDESTIPSTFAGILYALEMPEGWFSQHGILAGDRVRGLPPPKR